MDIKIIEINNRFEGYSAIRYPKIICVYFLIYNGDMLYIGKTKNFQSRMCSHHNDFRKLFDKVGYIQCKTQDESSVLEEEMIEKYNPPQNGDDPIPVILRGY